MAEELNSSVGAVRRFNRFHTRQVGVLQEGLLRSLFSPAEARVLYELAYRDQPTAAELCKDLGLDAGYLSRILRGFERGGLIDRRPSTADGRQNLLALTADGRAAFGLLEQAAREQIGAMLGALPAGGRGRLLEAMRTIEGLLGAGPAPTVAYLLRPQEPGDLGWIVHRHGVLYAAEYGFDAQFEALVAEIVAQFGRHHDPGAGALLDRPSGMPLGSARCCWSGNPTRSRSSACSWSSPRRAGSASAPVWSRSASASPGARATGRSPCGPTACCTPHVASTRRRATAWFARRRTAASARI